MAINQAYIFLIFILNGLLIGFVFDIFRILRISFKTKDFITYLEDILFWIITGGIILYSSFTFNNGEIRFFMFLAIFIGISLYMMLFTKYIIAGSVEMIKIMKSVVRFIFNIIKIPIIFLAKILKRLGFVFFNYKLQKNHKNL